MFKFKKIVKEKLLKQLIFSFGFRVITPLIMLITTPILLKNLGVEDYGGWSLLITTISWLTICDFGVSNQVRNESKILILCDKLTETKSLFTVAFIITSFLSVVFSLILSVLAISITYKSFLSLVFFMVVQVNVCRAIFFSLGKPEFSIAITNVPNVLILIFVFLKNTFTLNDIMFVYASGTVIMFLISYAVIFKHGTGLELTNFRIKAFTETLNKYSILKGGGGFFLVQLVSIALLLSDRYILSIIFGNDAVSKYDVILKIANFCIMFFSIVNTVLWSRFTELWATKELKVIKKIFRLFDLLALLLFIVLSVVFYNLNYILDIWLGNYNVSYNLFYISGVILYLFGYYLMSAYSSFLNGIGMIKIQFIIQAIMIGIKAIFFVALFYSNLGQFDTSYIIWGGLCLCATGIIFREKAYAKINN